MKITFEKNYSEIISPDNLFAAWQEFTIGKRSKKDVQNFSLHLSDNILQLHRDLANFTYRHGGYSAFNISDPKPRNIHKASIRDRVLHHAIYRQLHPFFDRTFIPDSFSCRINKGTHRAMNRFQAFAWKVSGNHTKNCWVLKCDIKKFFGSIDHAVLLKILITHVRDEKILWLLQNLIESFNSGSPGKGLPLGNLTSQLFCNVYMNEFDQFVKHRLCAKNYIRYADDFVFMSNDERWLRNQIPRISEFLENQLQLHLHPNKLFVKNLASGVDFLGWVHFSKFKVVRSTTQKRMVRRISEQPTNETIQSYLGLLRHGDAYDLQQEILNLYGLLASRSFDHT